MKRPMPRLLAVVATAVVAWPAAAAPPGTGAHWTTTRPGPAYAVDMFADGTAIATMGEHPVDGRVVRSRDFGKTWVAATYPETDGGVVRMGTPTTGFVVSAFECLDNVCDRDVYRTDDGARTWRRVSPLPAPPRGTDQLASFQYAVAPGGRMVVVTAMRRAYTAACAPRPQQHTAAEIFVSRDAGRSWTHSQLPRNAVIVDVAMHDERHGVLHAWETTYAKGACDGANPREARSGVWVTHDGARTWQRAPVACAESCQSIAIASPSRILVSAHWGLVHISTDGGRTFRTVSAVPAASPDTNPTGVPVVGAFAFATPLVGYAIAFPGGILRTTDGGLTWTPEASPYVPMLLPHDMAAAGPRHAVAAVGGGLLTRDSVVTR